MTSGRAGETAIAVIGQHAVTADQLVSAAERIRAITDLEQLAASLVGSSHLVASVAGRVRMQGTVTGIRRVFHGTVNGTSVAANRADVLAGLLHAGLDEQRLALQLLEPHILYPLAGEPVWQAVELLPTDHYLVLDRDGRHRSIRWWRPPEPAVPMAKGAAALREALSAAVAARIQGHELVSSDLGGLDSTAICSLAARQKAKVVAYTAASPDPLADDVAWAGRTVAGLGNVEHHIIPENEMPLVYHGLLTMDDQLDEPCNATVDRDRWLTIAGRAAARGSKLHLTGFGGDELLYGSLAHLHSMLRTSPRVALRHLRGFAAKYRWPRRQMLRQLSDHSSYRDWLTRVADTVTEPLPSPQALRQHTDHLMAGALQGLWQGPRQVLAAVPGSHRGHPALPRIRVRAQHLQRRRRDRHGRLLRDQRLRRQGDHQGRQLEVRAERRHPRWHPGQGRRPLLEDTDRRVRRGWLVAPLGRHPLRERRPAGPRPRQARRLRRLDQGAGLLQRDRHRHHLTRS